MNISPHEQAIDMKRLIPFKVDLSAAKHHLAKAEEKKDEAEITREREKVQQAELNKLGPEQMVRDARTSAGLA